MNWHYRWWRIYRRLAFLLTGGFVLQQAVGCEAIPAGLTAGVLSSVAGQIISNAFSIWFGLGESSGSFF